MKALQSITEIAVTGLWKRAAPQVEEFSYQLTVPFLLTVGVLVEFLGVVDMSVLSFFLLQVPGAQCWL